MKGLVVYLIACAAVIVGGWVWSDPHAYVPVVSRVVCSVRGGSWTEGSAAWGIEPGCYRWEGP